MRHLASDSRPSVRSRQFDVAQSPTRVRLDGPTKPVGPTKKPTIRFWQTICKFLQGRKVHQRRLGDRALLNVNFEDEFGSEGGYLSSRAYLLLQFCHTPQTIGTYELTSRTIHLLCNPSATATAPVARYRSNTPVGSDQTTSTYDGGAYRERRQAVWLETFRLGDVVGWHDFVRSVNVVFLIGHFA